MHIGFSGTQEGMSYKQLLRVTELMDSPDYKTSHSGDCIGADQDFVRIARIQGLHTVGHPPIKENKRTFEVYDEERTPKEYLDRNKDIVDESDCMIFTPKEFTEQLRSGTWSTKRYCVEQGKTGIIIYPDGTMENV